MRTTNWERCTSLDRLLVLCEDHRDRLEAMPSGKALLDQLRESVRTSRAHFMTSRAKARSGGRNATRRAAQDRCFRARLVRMLVSSLLREARRAAAATGSAADLPMLRWGSHRGLVAHARLAQTAIAPFLGKLGAYRIACYKTLSNQIDLLCAAMEEQEALRRRGKAMSAALKKGWEAAAGLDPLYFAVVKGDPGKTAEWKKVFGPDRRARLGLTAETSKRSARL